MDKQFVKMKDRCPINMLLCATFYGEDAEGTVEGMDCIRFENDKNDCMGTWWFSDEKERDRILDLLEDRYCNLIVG